MRHTKTPIFAVTKMGVRSFTLVQCFPKVTASTVLSNAFLFILLYVGENLLETL